MGRKSTREYGSLQQRHDSFIINEFIIIIIVIIINVV